MIIKLPAFGIRKGERIDDLVITPKNDQWRVWQTIAGWGGPFDQEEIADYVREHYDIDQGRARCSNLHQANLIEVWDYKQNRRGQKVAVYVQTPYGRREYITVRDQLANS